MSYYSELIYKVKEYIEDNKIKEAKEILSEELKMPYIPKEYEEELKSLDKTVNEMITLEVGVKETSIEKIEEYLNGDAKMQLQAVAALFEKNMRNHIAIISNYLLNNPVKEAAALLIDSMIDQQLQNQFEYSKEGINYSFIPAYLNKPCETVGFLKADDFLQEWIANENPSMYEMCLQLLIREAYLMLPLEIDEDESKGIALSILKNVMDLMGETTLFEKIKEEYELSDNLLVTLNG